MTKPRNSKKFGTFLGEYEDKGSVVKFYQDGNQIYFVKDGKILPDMTIHVDDRDELIEMLEALIELKEEEESNEG